MNRFVKRLTTDQILEALRGSYSGETMTSLQERIREPDLAEKLTELVRDGKVTINVEHGIRRYRLETA